MSCCETAKSKQKSHVHLKAVCMFTANTTTYELSGLNKHQPLCLPDQKLLKTGVQN